MSATAPVLLVPERPTLPRPRRTRSARPAHEPRAARCAAARPAPPARRARPLRLTRRGRLVVTCTAATLLTGAVVAVTGAFTGAAAGVERPPAPVVVTVLPGQTLSQIAGEWAPTEDWREVAVDIVQRNALADMTVRAGQRLTMPSGD
ncbi:hypothetical protein FHR75_000589 [Kineococcus radiotolerans]|uniref:Peptidoglycan-binding LysM n=1 Tax=Kineococcus radiotolerans TaxID=131568 RepID=A0A7W4TK75_KINRA|nr:hypothetical protein [Kineococcus radiotolerans]MBB2899801.1 hypothetical protein [Kineococcus radiotolerans]